jgi:hypothetical protein
MVDKQEASCNFIFQGNLPVEAFHIMELQLLPLLELKGFILSEGEKKSQKTRRHEG